MVLVYDPLWIWVMVTMTAKPVFDNLHWVINPLVGVTVNTGIALVPFDDTYTDDDESVGALEGT